MVTAHKADELFDEQLQEKGLNPCPKCGTKIDRASLAWNNVSTEAGTGYMTIRIECQNCLHEVAYWQDWYPGADSFEEFVENVGLKSLN